MDFRTAARMVINTARLDDDDIVKPDQLALILKDLSDGKRDSSGPLDDFMEKVKKKGQKEGTNLLSRVVSQLLSSMPEGTYGHTFFLVSGV